ncbi:response regulator transcription factor [Ferruginibacter sp. HRS2-29]|uniref:response regulator transcription factor n=1 Tax=Ferruginibacter sp. HRS2-29 TaxID=2487334 RepID=UPI0020CCFA4A|nr:response regulator transcription factor [Ferruginibacter sp. HRS2-29]MCP9751775.1 DNA-binding response regulator [Ferruginibacter sp. HRS2-29]
MKVIIFEDNFLVQQSLCEVLQSDEQIKVCGTYENAKGIDRIYAEHSPDLVIMDIDMPEVNGLAGLSLLKQKNPDARVLMFTVFEENDKVLNAICLGANGYILKSSSGDKIIESVKDVINGGSPLTPAIASKILKHFPKNNVSSKDELLMLTSKEKEVLELLVKGYSYKKIAVELFKSVETIRTQIKTIYRKLNVKSNAEAIIKALARSE